MKIAFIHYHLKTGGVTTVLQQQVEAIGESCEVLVLTGEPPHSPFPADFIHIPDLNYGDPLKGPPDAQSVADSVINAIFSKWKDGCDVLHVHNPLLAKNKIFLKILESLQERNIRLFIQIHDFAEDGRPASYFSEPYPSNCHYSVINSRDYNILQKAGLKKDGLHIIPNTIRPLGPPAGNQTINSHQDYVLYPIRALRRKNIGEAILLSLFFNNEETLAITLPPNSPMDLESYDNWKRFTQENDLHVTFDVGLQNDFASLVHFSKYLITTSITEGFGFSFLEPWTAEKTLLGRKLPEITNDFESNGIHLNHLYDQLLVPIEWLGKDSFFTKWSSCIRKIYAQFNFTIDDKDIQKTFAQITDKGNIDFGLLDEISQKTVISRVLSSIENLNKLKSLNPYLEHFGEISNVSALVKKNRSAVLNRYNNKSYRDTLLRTYRNVINKPIDHNIDKNVLLSQFLNLENFSLLKWGEYV